MSEPEPEPRRSTRARARAREDAAPPPAPSKDTPAPTAAKSSLKRKRTSTKDSTPATPVAEPAAQPLQHVLPVRLAEGQPLPTLPEPQPVDVPAQAFQSVQQSGVLSASLQRSRAAWISGSNFRLFHAFFTPPKKVADRTEEDKQAIRRQKEIIRNFPQLGTNVEAQLVIEPHTFSIRLYGPREIIRTQPKKQPAYGAWPNHNNQYSPYQQYNNAPTTPYQQSTTPQPRPSQPKPPQQKAPPAKPATPAPDPVIHMLAQRAGTDPELKAVMKIVAEGRASKEQLEFFQGHINELTKILAKQKEAAARAAPPPPPPPAPAPAPAPAPPPAPAPRPPPPAAFPPRVTYRPLVFDFVEGNGDKFYFPSYSVMEWLPNNQGAKFSFLITKMRPKPKPKEATPSTPAPKAPTAATPNPVPVGTPATPAISNANPNPNPNSATPTPAQRPLQPHGQAPSHPTTPAPTPTTYLPAPRIEDFDDANDVKDVEFYQPVTVIIFANNYEILQSLPRAVRPPDMVNKYMDKVFDTSPRAEETYLAFRLPKEDVDGDVKGVRDSGNATPVVATPIADVVMTGIGPSTGEQKKAGRPRKSLAV
ncbi:hypothetical protein BDV96DRAFT_509600 [Lophiotrema nucula]|uniref:SWR1-complex protein 3 domain-containing protein n=1 Tax=Lophiotrema nucula TaxID=690887 RepID=A0A6A5YG63_9PLEO|nr:hypothetical protein BDV96DRAFT_509600 [Lophiotrema nucula]